VTSSFLTAPSTRAKPGQFQGTPKALSTAYSFHLGRRPRFIDDASLPSRGQEFLSPSDACIAIRPSRSSSLCRTNSTTDLDEYASAVAPAWETYESTSAFNMPLLPSRGTSNAGSRSQAVPRTIRSGSSISSASSPNRMLLRNRTRRRPLSAPLLPRLLQHVQAPPSRQP
jgi:hypothetical protein